MESGVHMHKADNRPEKPDKQQFAAFFGALALIAVTIVLSIVA